MSDNPQTTGWIAGQQAVISREIIVSIDRVTPAGRAIVNGRTFEVDGRERTSGDTYRRSKLEPLSDEIKEEMALRERASRVSRDGYPRIERAEKWFRQALGSWGGRIPERGDVEKAERLVAAIADVMGDVL